MWKNRRFWIALGVGLGVLVLSVLLRVAQGSLPILTGYAAKTLASGIFVARRSFESVIDEDMDALAANLTWDINETERSVTVSALGYAPRTAVYHKGLGVTLLPPDRNSVLFNPEVSLAPITRREPGAPWPLGDDTSGDAIGTDTRAYLEDAVQWAFDNPEPDYSWGTRAVIVAQNGHILMERYGSGLGLESPLLGWSMSKSIVNALVGILVAQGKLDVTRPAPVLEWEDPADPRHAITIDLLLRMSSGLVFNEHYSNPFGNVLPMLFLEPDCAAYAARQPLAAPPGERWSYSSGTTNLLCRLIRETVGGTETDYFNFPRTALFGKLGMTSAVMEPDASGTFVGSSYTFATARDWARFGQFYLQDGVWNGERILPEGWVAYSTAPVSQSPQGRYGAHWWLNAGEPGNPENRWMPRLPPDMYFASGHEGQFVVVVPSRDAVIVRLGVTRDRQFDLETFVRQILEALPDA